MSFESLERRWSFVATVALGLAGLGVMAGQNFALNGWVLAFWIPAIILLVVRFIHNEPEALEPLAIIDAEKSPASTSPPRNERPSDDPVSPSQVVTLYRLFKEDVPGVKSIDFLPIKILNQATAEVLGIEPRLHIDFVGLSKFVSFYVPPSSAAGDIIRMIADNYAAVTGIDIIELVLTKPGEYPRSTDGIKFTGSVVIYYADMLSNATLASLEAYYKERQLTPIWRSTGYVQTQILLRTTREALDRLLKVPEKMQAPGDELLVITGLTGGVDGEQIQIFNRAPKAQP